MIHDKPTYEHSRDRHPARVREILRISAILDRPHVAREIILEWLENEAQTDLPEPAWKGQAFHHRTGDRVFTSVSAKEEASETWALRYVEPEEAGVEREWTTEVAIREKPGTGQHLFSLRTLVKSVELKLRIQPVVPKFLVHVANECKLQQGAAAIEKDPWIIGSDYEAANLTEFLVDPERRTPAFVLTGPEESRDPNEPLLDPRPLAADTLGTAKVIVLPAEYTWKLTNRFGKRLSVYRGAMRVYLAGFSDHADPEGGHDLFMPHRMDNPESASKLGSLLRWMAARESLRRIRLEQDVLPFASVLMPSVDLETARLEKDGASETEQLEAAKQHLGILGQELKLALQMQQWLTEENKAIESRARESEAKLRSSQNRGRPPMDRYQRDRPRPRYNPYRSDYRPGPRPGPRPEQRSGYRSDYRSEPEYDRPRPRGRWRD